MAIDEELLARQRDPNALPVARFFRWSEPTVSFGRTQDPEGAQAFARSVGARAVVRRPTGGGMVFHETDLSLSLAWRRDAPGFPVCIKNVYAAIHNRLADVLRRRGLDVSLHDPTPSQLPGRCFVEPVESDVMWNGNKIIGGALRATSWGRLYQGDIRLADMAHQGVRETDFIEGFLL